MYNDECGRAAAGGPGERLSELFPKCRPQVQVRDPRDVVRDVAVRDVAVRDVAVRDVAVRDVVSLGLRLPHAHDANNKMDVKNRDTERWATRTNHTLLRR